MEDKARDCGNLDAMDCGKVLCHGLWKLSWKMKDCNSIKDKMLVLFLEVI